MRAVLKAQINKTDRNDARGIAQMMRVGLYPPKCCSGLLRLCVRFGSVSDMRLAFSFALSASLAKRA
jgi:hypothetical protein